MIPVIKRHYLKMLNEWSGERADKINNGEDPSIWDFDAEEIAYMDQIETVDDLLNYTPSTNGKMQALVYDIALEMGLSKHDAMSAANDH